ncbi:Sapep family Mn(2+)-dependent dipeptidase [Clostridium sp. B9]|uniref:Sapep family Mn(2+)-dependent dipeptidase n=1 Tax=Clostridium sp. B9 TaxID=3423224 RepID=UPI003D2EF728
MGNIELNWKEDLLEVESRINDYKYEIIESIRRVVKIESVQGEATKDNPFGIKPKLALEEALKISEELGFKTKNIENAIGYAQYGDFECDDYIGVIGHVDVVEAGEGWSYSPFDVTKSNGRLYGRGVLDNKGPIMAALYSLKIIKDMGLRLKKNVRIIFGTNEESGFKDIAYYLKNEKPPIMGFTPDCKYPVIYGERGRLFIKLTKDVDCFTDKYFNKTEYEINELMNINIENELEELDFEDESGKLSLNQYKVELGEGTLDFYIKIVYPVTITFEEINNKLLSIAKKKSFNIKIINHLQSVSFDKKSNLISILENSFEEVTGKVGKSVPTNGGTYAKVMPNIVPFGPSLGGLDGNPHMTNEYIEIEELLINIKIFINSIYKLSTSDG